ncbi:ferric reductase-like transmembrane domain-containing protein [Streptomyces sp. NPDC054958]
MRDAAVRVRGGMSAGAGVVTLLWAAQVRPSARPDALFATAAHLSGLLAGHGVLVLLFLMARVPAVEHGVGVDRLARRHAFGGRYVLLLVFGHGLFALLGYAVHEGTDVVSAVSELLGYPALAAAAAGTVLLVAVGVTSARAVRRRVPHETWRGVHLLVYLAAALAFGHQLAGPDLAAVGWFWSLAHTVVAVLLVWYRAVVPVRQALRHALLTAAVDPAAPVAPDRVPARQSSTFAQLSGD